MSKLLSIGIIGTLLFLSTIANGQINGMRYTDTTDIDETYNKHTVYGNIGWAFVIANMSINYEYKFFEKQDLFINSLSIKASGGIWAVMLVNGRFISVSAIALSGGLEYGVGIAKLDNMDSPIGFANSYYLPTANIGYRYEPPKDGVVFRVGLNFPQGVYMSLGYKF